MFSYYGSKSKVVKYYPAPMFDTIIEPFAGSARYSLYGDNWKKNVVLIEKFDKVYRVWKYLQSAKESDILSLPDVEVGHSTKEHSQLCDEEVWLIGFCVARGSAQPQYQSGAFNSWQNDRLRISKDLHKIKHWNIRFGDYRELSDIEGTYFVDPPYQFGGEYYTHNNKSIDYSELADWCYSRKGQVIVCENTKANWMPFEPLKEMHGQIHTTTEAMWTNMPVEKPQLISLLDIISL